MGSATREYIENREREQGYIRDDRVINRDSQPPGCRDRATSRADSHGRTATPGAGA